MNEAVRLPVGSYEDVLIEFLEDSDYNPSRVGSVEHYKNAIDRLKTDRETFNFSSEEEARKFINEEDLKTREQIAVLKENITSLKDYQKRTMRVYGLSLKNETDIPRVHNNSSEGDEKAEEGQFYLDLMDSLQQRLSNAEKGLIRRQKMISILVDDYRDGSTQYIDGYTKEIDFWISMNKISIEIQQKNEDKKMAIIEEIKQNIMEARLSSIMEARLSSTEDRLSSTKCCHGCHHSLNNVC